MRVPGCDSTDYGRTWDAVPGLTADTAVFSVVPLVDNHLIFATPAARGTAALYVFTAASFGSLGDRLYPTPFHFDDIIPHPADATKFLGVSYHYDMVEDLHGDEVYPIRNAAACTYTNAPGITCTTLDSNLTTIEWAEPACVYVFGRVGTMLCGPRAYTQAVFRLLNSAQDVVLMAKYEGAIANQEVSFVRWQAPFVANTRTVCEHLYNFEQSGRFLFATAPPSSDGFDEVRGGWR